MKIIFLVRYWAVPETKTVHSGEDRPKIVGHERVTLEDKKFNILLHVGKYLLLYMYFILSNILHLNIFSNI